MKATEPDWDSLRVIPLYLEKLLEQCVPLFKIGQSESKRIKIQKEESSK